MSEEPRPAILRRLQLSLPAWQLLLETTAAVAGLEATLPVQNDAGTRAPLEADTAQIAWAELNRLGLSPAEGRVTEQWMGALTLLLDAPITIRLQATFNGISTTSTIGLKEGRGLAAHQRSSSEQTPYGTQLLEAENSVEVTLFDEENVWAACERLLPPIEAIRANAKAAPLNSTPDVVLKAGSDTAQLPEPWRGLFRHEEANVTTTVLTTAHGRDLQISAGMWSYSGGRLFSLRTAAEPTPELRITHVPPGNIANELVFALLGAHDRLDSALAEESL